MHCPEFLALYSDYRDGLIANLEVLRQVRRHLADCPRCRRYDAAIRWGVATLRGTELDVISGGPRAIRVHDRADFGMGEPRMPVPAGFMGGLMLAAAFTLLAWETVAVDTGVETRAVDSPRPNLIVIANPGVPFVRFVHSPSQDREDGQPAITDSVTIQPAFTLYRPTPQR